MKPYVYNADYYAAHTMRRLPYPFQARKPWRVGINGGIKFKKFRTHAKAIAYADKMARIEAKEQA